MSQVKPNCKKMAVHVPLELHAKIKSSCIDDDINMQDRLLEIVAKHYNFSLKPVLSLKRTFLHREAHKHISNMKRYKHLAQLEINKINEKDNENVIGHKNITWDDFYNGNVNLDFHNKSLNYQYYNKEVTFYMYQYKTSERILSWLIRQPNLIQSWMYDKDLINKTFEYLKVVMYNTSMYVTKTYFGEWEINYSSWTASLTFKFNDLNIVDEIVIFTPYGNITFKCQSYENMKYIQSSEIDTLTNEEFKKMVFNSKYAEHPTLQSALFLFGNVLEFIKDKNEFKIGDTTPLSTIDKEFKIISDAFNKLDSINT